MKFIIPKSSNLSLSEIGLLTTMLNVDEANCCSIEELCKFTSDKIVDVASVLRCLYLKGYVDSVDSYKQNIQTKYFVNKKIIDEIEIKKQKEKG